MMRTTLTPQKMVFGVLIFGVVLAVVAGCAGSSRKAEQKGSLSRTFMLLDEEGRKAGKLVLAPSGKAELLDENDQVVGQLTFVGAAAEQPAVAPSDAETPSESKEPNAEPDDGTQE
jgi:hypothetical protein